MDDLVAPGLGSRITFGGLATGLDTGAIVEALMRVERRPVALLQNRRSALSAQQQAMQTLSTRLLALRDAARALDNFSTGLSGPAPEEEFLAYSATSSDEGILVAETTAGATPGSFQVRVDQLATTARLVSVGFADPDAALAPQPRNYTISYGGAQDIDFQLAGGSSLYELRDAINTDPNNDGSVVADVIFDGSEYRLLVSGTEFGAANDVTLNTNFNPPGPGSDFLDASAGQSAEDAQLNYLGLDITRSSNDVTDLVPGVTLRLRATSTDPVTVDVSRDDEAIEEKLQALVDAYNEVRQFSIDQTNLDPTTNRGGVLIGDSLLRRVEVDVQRALLGPYDFTDNPFSSLGQLGLSFDADGLLGLDAEKLRSALDQDAGAVRELLSGDGTAEGDGIATALHRALEPIVAPGDGFLAARADGFDDRIETIDRQIERLEARLVLREEFLVRRFSELESLISTITAQSGFLGGFG